ncbi:MAG: cytochrome b N-terminal domain-containing protein [Dokdonella sp.]|nr:cytochrome b N-terminal domain-containing protein [Dokdonella sp.]
MSSGPVRAAWLRIEEIIDPLFPGGTNPMRNLGALACLMFAALLVSGVYLYAFFDTSVDGAWTSVDRLSREQPWLGGWLRSMHRYAADLFLIFTLLHLLREWVLGHYSRFRAVTWLTGVPLLAFMYVSGIGGFWLNWDVLGQYAATASAELIDALPMLDGTLARNFLDSGAVSDRFFSLLVFIHLGVPLLLLFGLWFHLQRVTRPRILPPRALLFGQLVFLATMALAWPVTSGAPADLDRVPVALALDWFVLHPLPLATALSAAVFWSLLAVLFGVLLAMPVFYARHTEPVAVVDADNCNGCRRCVDDCPYSAITLEAHPDGKPGKQIAVVAVERCASCGICAGACPSATPFRSVSELVNGIDMPQQSVDSLRRKLVDDLAHAETAPVVVFGCRHGIDVERNRSVDVLGYNLLCIGLLPPSFIEYALRGGAAGVVVCGCADASCEFRLGNQWTRERMLGTREPHLRRTVPPDRHRVVMLGRHEQGPLDAAIDSVRKNTSQGGNP